MLILHLRDFERIGLHNNFQICRETKLNLNTKYGVLDVPLPKLCQYQINDAFLVGLFCESNQMFQDMAFAATTQLRGLTGYLV